VDGGGDWGGEVRIEGVHDDGADATKAGLDGARGGGEVRREGLTRHVSVAGGVHGDAVALVKAVAAEIGGVDEGGACRVELRHEGVGLAAAEGRLEGPRRRWEVAGTSETRHVGVPHGVDGDAE